MGARILLVRHGRSAHTPGGWHTASGVRGWLKAYDVAGLADDDAPPASLIATALTADIILSSDLPRAVQSSARVAPGRIATISPLLREADMPIPELGGVRMPIVAWAVAIGIHWRSGRRSGFIPGPRLRKRAYEAATMLGTKAGAGHTVFAVTHYTIRTLIAEVLVASGWVQEKIGARHAHWSAWGFHR